MPLFRVRFRHDCQEYHSRIADQDACGRHGAQVIRRIPFRFLDRRQHRSTSQDQTHLSVKTHMLEAWFDAESSDDAITQAHARFTRGRFEIEGVYAGLSDKQWAAAAPKIAGRRRGAVLA